MDEIAVKQVLVIRKDLNMRKGKMVTQGSHASMKVFFDKFVKVEDRSEPGSHTTYMITVNDDAAKWIEGIFTKICVSVNSEGELLDIYNKALEKGLLCALIKDAGLTEFGFYLCKRCGDAIYEKGHTENCGYPLCECGDKAEVGERKPIQTYTACSIGPARADVVNEITGNLPLL